MADTDPRRIAEYVLDAHDWRAECSGLAYMICEIAEQYRYAREHWGGDSEFLANRILEAERYVNGPMLELYKRGARIDGEV